MKGLLRYLSPLAPDQSGAASVLYGMDCITVICDAGGCTGNICGFDEPRWHDKPGALFSAGLRDMDAILGRDDRLVEKLADAAKRIDASFSAIIGTPVPAVIGTDYRALSRLAEKKCGMPSLAVECTGTRLYDEGESETYLTLFKKFTEKPDEPQTNAEGAPRILGILGMTPLGISLTDGKAFLQKNNLFSEYDEICAYGMGDGLESVKNAARVTENLVVSPSGLKAAKYLEKTYGIPYRWGFPFISRELTETLEQPRKGKMLVIHQQAAAVRAREILEEASPEGLEVTCATWFLQPKELKRDGDLHLETEAQFAELCREGGFDTILADQEFLRAAKFLGFKGELIEFPHFSVSGVLIEE